MRRPPAYSWASIPLYLMLVAAPAYEVWHGVSPVGVWPARTTRQGFLSGDVTRGVEHRLDERSAVAKRLRPTYIEAAFPLLHVHPPDVVVGKDGWLFFGKTVVDYPPGNWRVLAGRMGRTLRALQEEVRRRGGTLWPIIIPNKASIASDKLRRKRPLVYAESIAILRHEGVARLFDLRGDLVRGGKPLYYRAGTHWSQRASFRVARRITTAIRRAYPNVEQTAKTGCRFRWTRQRLRMPDLLRMLGVRKQGRLWRRHTDITSFVEVRHECLDRLPATSPRVVLAGTSFSRSAGWSRLLSAMIGRRVEDHAHGGQKIRGLIEVVNEIATGSPCPDLLLLEFPERLLFVNGEAFSSRLKSLARVLEAMRLPRRADSEVSIATAGITVTRRKDDILQGRTFSPQANVTFRFNRMVPGDGSTRILFGVRVGKNNRVRVALLTGPDLRLSSIRSLFVHEGYWNPVATILRSTEGRPIAGMRIFPTTTPGTFSIRTPSIRQAVP